jgi:hypothetical protein
VKLQAGQIKVLTIIHGYIFQWEEFFLKNLDDALEITSFLILQAIHTPRVQKVKLSSIFCNSKPASEISLLAGLWGGKCLGGWCGARNLCTLGGSHQSYLRWCISLTCWSQWRTTMVWHHFYLRPVDTPFTTIDLNYIMIVGCGTLGWNRWAASHQVLAPVPFVESILMLGEVLLVVFLWATTHLSIHRTRFVKSSLL